jgi:hypothetical protein
VFGVHCGAPDTSVVTDRERKARRNVVARSRRAGDGRNGHFVKRWGIQEVGVWS